MHLPLLQKFPRRGDYEEPSQILLRAFMSSLACLVPGCQKPLGGKLTLSASLRLPLLGSSPHWANLDVVPIRVPKLSAKECISLS